MGYQTKEKIYENSNSVVYRGVREVDNQPVILKLLQGEYPTPQQLTSPQQAGGFGWRVSWAWGRRLSLPCRWLRRRGVIYPYLEILQWE